jgi:hypothetical protein
MSGAELVLEDDPRDDLASDDIEELNRWLVA